ncbi:class II aldolase/adducin family protein [Calditerricola satsumensis]|uniref:Aldolase n=1 Tax=Calditerricola satsumensis TaxID=373054 RepID=A0A8J3BDA2_9BACI|nr:class II aldolase/adducin family protein [Calditerricola satsumensis]GGK05568.1 aldolase [Calditerricola satsumensis]
MDKRLARQVVEIGRALYDKGLVAGAEGNISVRLSADTILITPSGKNKGALTEDDLVVVDLSGNVLAGKHRVSSEYRLHAVIYRERDDVGAVVHAHPPTATAFTVAGLSMMDPVLPEIVVTLGGVPTVPFAVPGTDALAEAVRPYLADFDALLLENHGAVTMGPDLERAHQKMESLEMAARIRWIARTLGTERQLTRDEVAALLAARAYAPTTAGRHPGNKLLKWLEDRKDGCKPVDSDTK